VAGMVATGVAGMAATGAVAAARDSCRLYLPNCKPR
jgi:hypothetical protein